MDARIAIIDYGMGNLRSVEKALERVGARPSLGADVELLGSADGLILPGVGAFPEAMRRIRGAGLEELIGERVAADTPLLGICLGMQLLFDSSTEHEGAAGLGLIPGAVEPLRADGLKVPHIGWSPARSTGRDSELVAGIADGEPFYFVHSLGPRPAEPAHVLANAIYGESFACTVARPPVYGTQFHPEKSSAAGLRLLRNFATICAPVGAGA